MMRIKCTKEIRDITTYIQLEDRKEKSPFFWFEAYLTYFAFFLRFGCIGEIFITSI